MPVALGSVVEAVGFFVCDAVGMRAFAMASVQRLRSAGGLVVLVFALAAAFFLRGAGGLVCLCLRWHPRFVSVLHASPLCGAAPTFLCRRKEK